MSNINIPTMLEFITFKSYYGIEQEHIRIIKDLNVDVKGKNIIIVEDIADTGKTLDFIIKYLQQFKSPGEIKVCVLFNKPSKRQINIPIDYYGFNVEDIFVVGYGLDYKEYFRELNDLREYDES